MASLLKRTMLYLGLAPDAVVPGLRMAIPSSWDDARPALGRRWALANNNTVSVVRHSCEYNFRGATKST